MTDCSGECIHLSVDISFVISRCRPSATMVMPLFGIERETVSNHLAGWLRWSNRFHSLEPTIITRIGQAHTLVLATPFALSQYYSGDRLPNNRSSHPWLGFERGTLSSWTRALTGQQLLSSATSRTCLCTVFCVQDSGWWKQFNRLCFLIPWWLLESNGLTFLLNKNGIEAEFRLVHCGLEPCIWTR